MVIMDGATATLTSLHSLFGVFSVKVSMAVFRASIPLALSTCMEPKYFAGKTFLGSSIGVGKQ